MPNLISSPTLSDFQQYVKELEAERDFAKQTVTDKCLLMGEEMGELFRAVRRTEGLAIDTNSDVTEIGDELADIFIYLCAIANRKEIKLEEAFRHKEEKNKLRKWTILE